MAQTTLFGHFTRIIFITLVLLGLAGCAATTDPYAVYKGQSAEQVFTNGERALATGKYETASKSFEALDAIYPFGPYAQRAQLYIIYAYYKNDDPASALAAADRYIRLYPRSPDVDYAYYMKGLVNFGRNDSWLDRMWPNDPADRDITYLRQSFADFNELVQFFPQSIYVPDARLRMAFIRNVLAQHELNVAHFYIQRKAYVAAANRAAGVVEHYQGAPQVIPALGIMYNAYQALNETQMADNALQTLLVNYPNSPEARSYLKKQKVIVKKSSMATIPAIPKTEAPKPPHKRFKL